MSRECSLFDDSFIRVCDKERDNIGDFVSILVSGRKMPFSLEIALAIL